MKTFLSILKWTGIVLGSLILLLVIAVYLKFPPKLDAPYPDITASTDSSVIAHGKYLVHGPAHCVTCHSTNNRNDLGKLGENVFAFPLSGGLDFNMPGAKIYSKNLTPDKETGIGRYNDREVARMIRHGVNAKNEIMFPFMSFGNVSDEDLTAIISYLRSLEPVKNEIPDSELNFIMKGLMAFLIEPYGPKGEVAKSVKRDTTIEYGSYLANSIAACYDCHTNFDMMTGKFIGKPFSGGAKTPSVNEDPNVWVMSPNLTPDPKTGKITQWPQSQFVSRMKAGRLVKESVMPWESFKIFDEKDLIAIYKYLQSLPPVYNEVNEVVITEK